MEQETKINPVDRNAANFTPGTLHLGSNWRTAFSGIKERSTTCEVLGTVLNNRECLDLKIVQPFILR